jgi:hypothetical protein
MTRSIVSDDAGAVDFLADETVHQLHSLRVFETGGFAAALADYGPPWLAEFAHQPSFPCHQSKTGKSVTDSRIESQTMMKTRFSLALSIRRAAKAGEGYAKVSAKEVAE